jgi:hypothetical protein
MLVGYVDGNLAEIMERGRAETAWTEEELSIDEC